MLSEVVSCILEMNQTMIPNSELRQRGVATLASWPWSEPPALQALSFSFSTEVHLGVRSPILSLSPKGAVLGYLFLPRMSPAGSSESVPHPPQPRPEASFLGPPNDLVPSRSQLGTSYVTFTTKKKKDTTLRLYQFLKSNEIGVQVTAHSLHIKNSTLHNNKING